MHVFNQSITVWKALFNFKNYKNREIFLKSFLLIFITPLMVLLWLLTWIFLAIERLISFLFKRSLSNILRFYSLKAYKVGIKKFLYNIGFILIFLISLPIIFVYYLSVMIKILLKSSMKNILFKLDFSIQFTTETLLIFDDTLQANSAFSAFFKDASQTEAFGKMLEDLINESPDTTHIIDDDSQERPK